MKHAFLFLCIFFMDALSLSALPEAYLKDIQEEGYCVIPQVLSTAEAELLYERVWHEYIEKAWPHCRMDDRSNWKEVFPMHTKAGVFAGPAGQTQVLWDLRQDPRIIEAFARLWNTHDLVVSMDGLSLMCPPEVREYSIEPWPHVDQGVYRTQNNTVYDTTPPEGFVSESSLKTSPYTIQGQFLFEDSFEGDGGFYCIPKSHLRFDEFAPQLDAISALEMSPEDKRNAYNNYLNGFFSHASEDSSVDSAYVRKHVTAPRGSLILWDSRTVHWNQHPRKDRPHRENPKVRMVGYLCYVPKARLTDEARAIRREAFETGVSTNHHPTCPRLVHTKDLIKLEFERYFEDPSYTQPKITLTTLGESLLGFE